MPLHPDSPAGLLSWGVGLWAETPARAPHRPGRRARPRRPADRADVDLPRVVRAPRRLRHLLHPRRPLRRRGHRLRLPGDQGRPAGRLQPRRRSATSTTTSIRRPTCGAPARPAAPRRSWSSSTPSRPSRLAAAPDFHTRRSRWLLGPLRQGSRVGRAGRCGRSRSRWCAAVAATSSDAPALLRDADGRTPPRRPAGAPGRGRRQRRSSSPTTRSPTSATIPSSPSTACRRSASPNISTPWPGAAGASSTSTRSSPPSTGGHELPERALLVSFDDCYVDLLTAGVPLLAERGVPAVAFAVAGLTGQTQRVGPAAGRAGAAAARRRGAAGACRRRGRGRLPRDEPPAADEAGARRGRG